MKLLVGQFLLLGAVVLIEAKADKKPFTITGRQHSKSVEELRKLHSSRPPKESEFFMQSFPRDSVLISLAIGTPAVDYQISVETGYNKLWLIDRKYPAITTNQKIYDPSASSTSEFTKHNVSGKSGEFTLYGAEYKDDISLYFTAHQTFATIWNAVSYYSNPPLPFDGILGLAWNLTESRSLSDRSSPILNFLDGYSRKVVTVWLERIIDTNSTDIGSKAAVSFGKIDNQNCDRNINYVPFDVTSNEDSDASLLRFYVDGFTVGTYTTKGQWSAVVDTGVSIIYMPKRSFLAVKNQFQPKYDYDLEIYVTLCSNKQFFSDWIFTIGGQDYHISAQEFIKDIGLNDGRCAFTIDDSSEAGLNEDYVFGIPFARTYCTIFDTDNNQLGLATAVHSS